MARSFLANRVMEHKSNPTVEIQADLVIIGGGAAGCMAAVAARQHAPGARVIIMEKAHITRSGCLAAGINALNAYLNPGQTPQSYLDYVRQDHYGLVREDLVLTIGQGLNQAAATLEAWGLPIPRDAQGQPQPRGPRSIAIHGEAIKPVMAAAARRSGAEVFNRTVATNLIKDEQGTVQGVYGFSLADGRFYVLSAPAVICATGGASGIYRPPNTGLGRSRLWYPPFNAGSGYAMGLRAGAEMTSLEMRFVALRVKDSMAPTGTLAQGMHTPQVNALGSNYLPPRASTAQRLAATLEQETLGLGPCYLDTSKITPEQEQQLQEAYLSMAPGMLLYWADASATPAQLPPEVSGSEPYVVGGHGMAGYWVDTYRRSTLPGLLAAGDVAGGAPKKYATGAMVEGELAALAALERTGAACPPPLAAVAEEYRRVYAPLNRNEGFSALEVELNLQKIMDEYAGGITAGYRLSRPRLLQAQDRVDELRQLANSQLQAGDWHQLMRAHEALDRIDVARQLVAHLLHREETRLPVYQWRTDYPQGGSTRWNIFVNSVYHAPEDRIEIRERPLAAYRATEGS